MKKYDELNEQVRRGQAGSKEDVLDVVNRFEPLIFSLAKRYCPFPKEWEDLVQEGRLEVLGAIYDFDFTKGVHFPGYVQSRLRHLYLEWGRKMTAQKPLSLDVKNEDGLELLDTLEDGLVLEEVLVRMEESEALKKAFTVLTDRQAFVIKGYYFHQLHMAEMAEYLGCQLSTVYNTKARALEKLRKALGEDVDFPT